VLRVLVVGLCRLKVPQPETADAGHFVLSSFVEHLDVLIRAT